jgi:hypothetical protein
MYCRSVPSTVDQHGIKPNGSKQHENRVPPSGYIGSNWLETLRISTCREVPKDMSVHLIILSGLKRHIRCTVRHVDWVTWLSLCGSLVNTRDSARQIAHGTMRDRLGAGTRFTSCQ